MTLACLQISNGISAIFGPQDTLLGNHIQSLCDALEIPHLEARLDLEPQIKEVSINLYPNANIIGNAIRDLINYLNWTQVAVIYEDDICKLLITVLHSQSFYAFLIEPFLYYAIYVASYVAIYIAIYVASYVAHTSTLLRES